MSAFEAIHAADAVIERVRQEFAARGIDWRTLPIEESKETRHAWTVAESWARVAELETVSLVGRSRRDET